MFKSVYSTIRLIIGTMARAGEIEANAYRIASRSSRNAVK